LTRAVALILLVLVAGCSSVPDGAYYPRAQDRSTLTLSHALFRAAQAAGDDPRRYSFARIDSPRAIALTGDDATFYFSDGLAKLPERVVEPVVAHEVAHEVLGHVGTRRTVSLSITTGFLALGFLYPGMGLLDFVVNPLVIRAFNRSQELAADRRAVEILRAMGVTAPRRALADALVAVDRMNGPETTYELLSWHPPIGERLQALGTLEPLPALAEGTDRS
jgi:Zn-dependent protease with chaperone function